MNIFQQVSARRGLSSVAAATLGAALVIGPAVGAWAAAPPVIGNDGDYRTTLYWDTTYSRPDGVEPSADFDTPTGAAFGADGSVYLIANYSSGSSELIQHHSTETGELLGSFAFVPTVDDDGELELEYYPTGIASSPDGSVWIVGNGEEDVAIAQFTADGTEVARFQIETGNSAVGLVAGEDGSLSTLLVDGSSLILATLNPVDGSVSQVQLPGASIDYAAAQLSRAPDGTLIWASYDLIYTVAPDGTGLTAYPTEVVQQATVGADGRLYTTDQNGTVQIRSLADPGTPGQVIAQRDTADYRPVQPMSTTGVTADAHGVLYVFGYFYGDPEATPPIEPFSGVTALAQIHSPSVPALSPAVLLTCEAFTSPAVAATGTPEPSWYEIIDGALPAGLTLDGSTGVVSGTPTTAGSATVTIRALNGVAPTTTTTTSDTTMLTLTVTQQPLTAGTPTITGSTAAGSTLVASTGTWTPTPDAFTYHWTRDGQTITGATASSYTLVPADAGRRIAVEITGSGACVQTTSATAGEVLVDAPATPTTEPTDDPTSAPSSTTAPSPTVSSASISPVSHSGGTSAPTAGPTHGLASTGTGAAAVTILLSAGLTFAGIAAIRRSRSASRG